MFNNLPGIAVVFDDCVLRFGEKAEALYRDLKKVKPIFREISGHHLLELPIDLYYSFNLPQLEPHLKVYILRRDALEMFVCDFSTGIVSFWISMPLEMLTKVRKQFSLRNFDICDVRVYHGYKIYPDRMQRLADVGVSEKGYHLFFSESFTLTPEEVEGADLSFDERYDYHFHPYTNIVWRSHIDTGDVINGIIVKQHTALILHAWWRGYHKARILQRPYQYTIVQVPDTRLKIAAIQVEVSELFFSQMHDAIRAAWRSHPNRNSTKWVDFTVETTWLDFYCNAKDFSDLSIICIKGYGLAPLTHPFWSSVAKPKEQPAQPKDTSLQAQLQKVVTEDVHIVPPKNYGLPLHPLLQNDLAFEENAGLLQPPMTKDNLLQRGLRMFLGR